MIQVYNAGNTNFNVNGDMVIQPISVILSNQINIIPSLEMELSYDEYGVWEYVKEDCVIKCNTPYGEDLFRVYNTVKNDDTYTVYAKHIFSDLIDTVAKDMSNDDICIVKTGNATGQQAIAKLFNNTDFTGHSDILKTDSVVWERKYITTALLGNDDNSFLKRWGGELYINKFDVYMYNQLGSDNNTLISYGKNLESIEEEIKIDEVVTRIIPVGANGLRLTGQTPWIDSPNINKYSNIKEKVVEFSNVKVKEKPEDEEGFATIDLARAELIRLSNLMFSEQHVDTPSVNIKTNMTDIRDSIEYQQLGYSGVEKIGLGDTVTCRHYKLGIETKARVISYKWDVLTEKFVEIEIGDTQLNYFDKQTDISNKVSKVLNDNGNVIAEYVQGIIDATKSKFRALKDVAQTQHIRAMLFEDLDSSSPTFGAMCCGTAGFEISNKRNSDDTDWNWTTFGTGKGFVADCITAGTINANLIKAGILSAIKIQNQDGSFIMDLGGTGGLTCKRNGQNSLSIEGSHINFYRFDDSGKYSGSIGTTTIIGDNTKQAINIYNDKGSYVTIGYIGGDGNIHSYMDFDESQVESTNKRSINFWKNAMLHNGACLYIGDVDNCYLTSSSTGGAYLGGDMYVSGTLSAGGSKTRVVDTSQGKRGLNAYETPNALFADYGHDTLDSNGECTINIDTLFLETVTASEGYEVFLTKYGKGDIWVEETNDTNFKVCGEPNLKFSWNIVLKQKGYENTRLQKIDVGDAKNETI
ncbi:phage tail spike protein [Inconstantimicrobium mannanitabidum]|uniref:Uncharacterized protein n=1 Tax=Inconstantimicrobium mannanitabidum TaxID=1604901 RepID=A0ACB5R940_9CLOT|nr:phage tail spike protein [Clostridium sp. TW13]GKX65652.1 hypothetical protein rsdtw13_09100 [Clostridium sp. TW13]